ncbi:MAG: sugar phosphate nucleotidyltransferase, partial [Planctomycetota bacterium]
MRYAVIMAGGAGKRLWPLSRLSRPKQLLPLVDGKNLLEVAVDRLEGQFAPEQIWIITNDEYAEQVRDALPKLPRQNIVGEPVGRDTANAIALAAELLADRDPDGSMAVFTADHVIRPKERFAQAVENAFQAAEENDALVTFGIRPTWPHTGLGYVHVGEQKSGPAHRVLDFKEKPDHQTARRYVDAGNY